MIIIILTVIIIIIIKIILPINIADIIVIRIRTVLVVMLYNYPIHNYNYLNSFKENNYQSYLDDYNNISGIRVIYQLYYNYK